MNASKPAASPSLPLTVKRGAAPTSWHPAPVSGPLEVEYRAKRGMFLTTDAAAAAAEAGRRNRDAARGIKSWI